MRQPQTCKFGTLKVSEQGLTKVRVNRLAVAIVADFDLTRDHYTAINATLEPYTAFKLAGQQARGFLLVFKSAYKDHNQCAQQVTSFLLKLTARFDECVDDKPVKQKPRSNARNSPYDNAATRAAKRDAQLEINSRRLPAQRK